MAFRTPGVDNTNNFTVTAASNNIHSVNHKCASPFQCIRVVGAVNDEAKC